MLNTALYNLFVYMIENIAYGLIIVLKKLLNFLDG